MKFLLLATTIFVVLYDHETEAKIFDRCSLTRELARLGVPRNQLATFVCIAQRESRFNTNAINRNNANGSNDFGIFQINDRFWCNSGRGRPSNNICKIHCNQLQTDDITAAVRCARTVHRQQGFEAWVTYNKFCSRGRAGSVANCGV